MYVSLNCNKCIGVINKRYSKRIRETKKFRENLKKISIINSETHRSNRERIKFRVTAEHIKCPGRMVRLENDLELILKDS